MEVRKGFKQTDIGVIPEDWDVKAIRSIAEIVGGGTPSTTVAQYWNGNIPWVSAGDISNAGGRYIQDTEYHISEIGLKSCPTNIMPMGTTVIIARGATVGRMAQLGVEMTFNQTCYGLRPISELDQDYLYYSMLFSINSIKSLTYGTIFGTITTNSFEQWKIPFPPFPEQYAIATALSDADALLATIDAFIAKKRLIKQGAMQELLMGKRRLPGFNREWEKKKIGDVLSYEQPGKYIVRDTEYSENSGIPVLTAGKTFILGYTHEEEGIYRNLPVIIFDDFTTSSKYVDFPFKVKSSAIKLLKIKNEIADLRFMFEKMQTLNFVFSEHKRYFISEYQNIEIKVPSLKEQQAIAEILTDMDDEIAALEQKRAKTRLLKQGMMQELLTGRIRLVLT